MKMYDIFWKLHSLVIKADCAGKERGIKFARTVVENKTSRYTQNRL